MYGGHLARAMVANREDSQIDSPRTMKALACNEATGESYRLSDARKRSSRKKKPPISTKSDKENN